MLSGQIGEQEKQFLELTETVKDLVSEKSRLQNTLAEKRAEAEALQGKFQRTKELLDAEKLKCCKGVAEMVHRACQTAVPEAMT